MATTYTLISSNVLSSSAASVTFSSIPSTYTDLVLRMSARSDGGGTGVSAVTTFNGITTNYSDTQLYGSGSTVTSGRGTTNGYWNNLFDINGTTSTASTFGSAEMYIPSYQVAQNKPMAHFGCFENNAATAYIDINSGLWSNTSAITSITLSPSAGNFVSGSSFYLYGIKNS